MKIDGRCHCGFITYEAEVDLEKVMICHCTDCQTLTGSAFRTFALTREDGFNLLSGKLKTYVKTSESGTKRLQTFCPNADPRSIRPRKTMARRSTAFVWARAVSSTTSCHEHKFGAGRPRLGSPTLGAFPELKRNWVFRL